MSVTEQQIQDVLTQRFGSLLRGGKHKEDGEACALEVLSVVRGIPWTDEPSKVRCWDLRSINDIEVSDEVRTTHLVPVLAAYADCCDWPEARQREVMSALVIGTVRYLIAALPGLPVANAIMCREADTLDTAAAAARAASAYFATTAAYSAAAARAASYSAVAARAAAARAAAYSASSAARAAAYSAAAARAAAVAEYSAVANAARETVFIRTCKLWRQATQPQKAAVSDA